MHSYTSDEAPLLSVVVRIEWCVHASTAHVKGLACAGAGRTTSA
jgi:hypothetical protein